MGANSAPKYIKAWIDEIPDSKLEGGIRDRVQVNKGCKHTTLKSAAPKSFAFIEAPIDNPWTVQEIRDALKASVTGWPIYRPGNKLS
ncbi:hypothetical protein BKA66DRAFT_569551 [Pyrenochaeta sp. MPI-SDFR-AT-0127]|nr:hypothetical protein BKA66DRAFT_569551 [Pyrenochaeta sp. MPI-SDFR-AT-0127]